MLETCSIFNSSLCHTHNLLSRFLLLLLFAGLLSEKQIRLHERDLLFFLFSHFPFIFYFLFFWIFVRVKLTCQQTNRIVADCQVISWHLNIKLATEIYVTASGPDSNRTEYSCFVRFEAWFSFYKFYINL